MSESTRTASTASTIIPKKLTGSCGDEFWDYLLDGGSISTESVRSQVNLVVLQDWAESYDREAAKHDSGFAPKQEVKGNSLLTVRSPA